MLRIQTFDARAGGNVIYKALAHPLAAAAIERLYARLEAPVALYDPDGIADALVAMYPASFDALFVQDVSAVGESRAQTLSIAFSTLSVTGFAIFSLADPGQESIPGKLPIVERTSGYDGEFLPCCEGRDLAAVFQ